MGFTLRELMHFIDKEINRYVDECNEQGKQYNINEFLNSYIILGGDEELNSAHFCCGFKFLTDHDKEDFNELDLGVELEEDKNYVLLS